jgi:ribosomal protein S18 acetylase RimI-like enzyme
MKIRKFVKTDLPTVVKLLNKIGPTRGLYEFIPYSQKEFLSEIKENNATVLVAEDNEIEGFVTLSRGFREEIQQLCVRLGPKRKRFEDLLIAEIEKEVKGKEISLMVSSRSAKVADFVRRGYEVEGGLYHLIIRLNCVCPVPPLPEGYVLRNLTSDEEDALIKAVNSAFRRERIQKGVIEQWKVEGKILNETWIHVADLKGKIVSVVVARSEIDYNRYFGARRGYFGPVATLPSHTRKGLATTLIRWAMNFLFTKGMDFVALYINEANIASLSMFRKIGFKVRHRWKFLHKHLQKH